MYNVDFTAPAGVDFNPPNEIAEILQNVKTILTTPRYTVPLDRRFGVDGDLIDAPINIEFFHRLQADIFQAVATYEPRAEIVKIDYKVDGDKVRPYLIIDVKGGTI